MWFWFAFGSAILGAIGIILNKKSLSGVSPALLTWCLYTLSIPPLILFALKEGIPVINWIFFVGVFGSSLTFVFSKTITNQTLKQNLISKVMPLTSFGGVFTYIFGLIFLNETIRFIPVLGLLSVLFGSYILNADQAKEDILKPFKLLFLTRSSVLFLLAIMLGSITAIFDKTGLNNTAPTSPAFTLLIEQVIMSAFMTFYLIRKESMTWILELKNNFRILFLSSIVELFVGLSVFSAYMGGPVALVLGVKRLQIFFILLLGYWFFKDRPTKHIWAATAIMILGVLMIRLG